MDRIRALKVAFLAATFLLASCATPAPTPPAEERYLTKEQDDAFRQRCAVAGCAIVPLPLMEKIMRQLQSRGA